MSVCKQVTLRKSPSPQSKRETLEPDGQKKASRRCRTRRPPWLAKVTREEAELLQAPLNTKDFEQNDCIYNKHTTTHITHSGGGAADFEIEEIVMTEHGSQTEFENADDRSDAVRSAERRPVSWSFDPVLAAYRSLLTAAAEKSGRCAVLDSALLDRWRLPAAPAASEPASPSAADVSLTSLSSPPAPRMARPNSGEGTPAVTEAMPGDGSPGMVGQASSSSEAQFGFSPSDETYTPVASPAALLLIPGHLPIRLDCLETGLVLTLLSYSPGLRRCGDRGTYTAEQLRAALRAARRGFSALRLTMAVCLDQRSIAAASLPHPDEQFLARELRYELRPAPFPPSSSQDIALVEIDGIAVRPGDWVWVRLETNAGLTMTEPALFLGAREVESSLQLTLRGLDRLTFTCITRGPGWMRRIVPMDEADIWRKLLRQERILDTLTLPHSRRTPTRNIR